MMRGLCGNPPGAIALTSLTGKLRLTKVTHEAARCMAAVMRLPP